MAVYLVPSGSRPRSASLMFLILHDSWLGLHVQWKTRARRIWPRSRGRYEKLLLLPCVSQFAGSGVAEVPTSVEATAWNGSSAMFSENRTGAHRRPAWVSFKLRALLRANVHADSATSNWLWRCNCMSYCSSFAVRRKWKSFLAKLQ